MNDAYGYTQARPAKNTKNKSLQKFVRGPGNRTVAVSENDAGSRRIEPTSKGITNLGSRSVGSPGVNSFTPDFRAAAISAIFDFGVAPSSIIPVNVNQTTVSVMQNYQGTSNITYNGS